MAHKFLIVNNQFRWSRSIDYHFELLSSNESRKDAIGGGLFYIDQLNKKIFLYHKSEDFGYVNKTDIISALDRTLISERYEGYKVFISKTDTLEIAMQQEKEDYIIDLTKPFTIDKVIEKDNSFKITNIRNVSTYVPIVPVKVKKISRNEPCKCGSGMKFKRCCGK
jgi:dTDP-D-glucose 4,6-dehydratase